MQEKQVYTDAILWLRTRARSNSLGRGSREAALTLECLAHYVPLAHGVRGQLASVLYFADLNRVNGHLWSSYGWVGVVEVVELKGWGVKENEA